MSIATTGSLPVLGVRAGFTGSRSGMSDRQKAALAAQLVRVNAAALHHGDCRGADEQAHTIGRLLNVRIVLHPPSSPGLRAFCEADEIREPYPFLVRNHHLVQESTVLLAAPDRPQVLRSGTWATVRYALRLGLPVIVIARDGSLKVHNLTEE